MVLYLDIFILCDILINSLFIIFIEKICKEKITKRIFIVLLLMSIISVLMTTLSLLSIYLYKLFKVISGVIIGLISFTALSKSQKIIKIALFYLCNLTLVGVLKSFSVSSWYYLLLALIIIFSLFIVENNKKYNIFLRSNKYNVSVIISQKQYNITGYFDTGNFASYEGIPIVFLSEALFKQIISENTLKEENSHLLVKVNTIKGENLIPGIKPKCFLIKYQKKKHYIKKVIICSAEISINEDCLLGPLLFM